LFTESVELIHMKYCEGEPGIQCPDGSLFTPIGDCSLLQGDPFNDHDSGPCAVEVTAQDQIRIIPPGCFAVLASGGCRKYPQLKPGDTFTI